MIHSSKAPRRKFIALAAVFGLLLQTVIASFPITVSASSAFGPAASDIIRNGDTLRTIVICTGQGLKRIILDADGKPVEAPASDQPNGFCPLCPPHAGCAAALPAVTILLPLPAARAAFLPPQPAVAGHERTANIHRTRAPPSHA